MGVSKKARERRIKACTKKGIDRLTCGTLVNIYGKLDDEEVELWRLAKNIDKLSRRDGHTLRTACGHISEAKDEVAQITGY